MDERFLKEEGAEVFTGNELLLKGALESGVSLITGYPGSPVSELFDAASACRDLLKKHGILAEMANNEALSVARLNGSRMAGARAMAVMKSVGLHVAADGLALGNLSEPNNDGGSVVIVGDDPWIDSTQINNDSRFLSQHLHMPVVEPATFQELKDWVGQAFELSSKANLFITYLVTTNQADGGGTVWVHPNRYPGVNTNQPVALDSERIDLDRNVLLPPRTWSRESTLPARFETLLGEARSRQLNVLSGPPSASIGFIASGLTYCYLEQTLGDLGLSGRFPILKLGLTYPVDAQAVLDLASRVKTIYVIEEKRGFIEQQVIQILHQARQASRPGSGLESGQHRGNVRFPDLTPDVWGKLFPGGRPGIPEARGLNSSILAERLIPVLLESLENVPGADLARLRAEAAILEATARPQAELPVRTPTFCPGCPHRDSSSVFLEIKKDFQDAVYMRREHAREPVDLIFHGETGCFTMLMFEPNKPLMHNYSGMGLGGGTGAGLDPFITNKQVVFLGDSTFFHSGMLAISDSIKSGQDITYVILDNKTTAMTGHQPTPGTDVNLMGEKTFAQSIEAIVAAMGGAPVPVTRVNPEYRASYRALLEDTVLEDGVKIVIADKECGLTYHRRQRRARRAELRHQGYLAEEKQINITPEVCEFCLECTITTGCPGLTIEPTDYGPKIVTDRSLCVSDGACAKVKACPSFEEVLVIRKSPVASGPVLPDLEDIPEPIERPSEPRSPFHIYVAGVGGMGAGLVSAVLVRAAHRQGYRVLFSDKKGLAVRNGGVYAHILFTTTGGALAPLVPYGKADLLIGLDLLEAARGTDPRTPMRVAHPDRTAVVANTAANPTILMLLGRDTPDPATYEALLKRQSRPGGYWGHDAGHLSEYYFGTKLYANMVLVGAAYQRGHLPLKRDDLEWAVRQSVPPDDRQANLNAFRLGRLLVAEPDFLPESLAAPTYAQVLENKCRRIAQRWGVPLSRAYRTLVEDTTLELNLDDDAHRAVALRAYDLIRFEGIATAREYMDHVRRVRRRDRHQWGTRATRAVIRHAFKVMAIKDEMFVAELLSSPEKYERDRERFQIDRRRGDRITYRHFSRPELTLFGRAWRWDLTTRDWQLRIVRHLKFLRRWWPGWHREEQAFRDWYLGLVRRFDPSGETAYELWLKILDCPEPVRGYREVRYPKMADARKHVELLWSTLRATEAGAAISGDDASERAPAPGRPGSSR